MTRFVLSLALVATVGLVAVGCSGSGASPSPSEQPASDPPIASPSAPVDSPSAPVDSPSAPPDGMETIVELDTVGGGPVKALVKDESGSLAGASSGDPAEGVSVDFDDVRVEAIDDDSIRLTWSDYPAPNEYPVLITIGDDGRFSIAITRPEPTGTTDAIALDRELVLDFHVAVPVTDVDATIG